MVDKRKFAKFHFKTRFCILCESPYIPVAVTQEICFKQDAQHLNFKIDRKRKNRNKSNEKIGKNTTKKKRIRRKYWLDKYKIKRGCDVCKFNKDSCALDWNHENYKGKEFNISRNILFNLKRMFNEIRKCQLLCANCHRIETKNQNIYYRKRLNT